MSRSSELVKQAIYDRNDAQRMLIASLERLNPERVSQLEALIQEALNTLPERTKRILEELNRYPATQAVRALKEQRRVFLLYTDKR